MSSNKARDPTRGYSTAAALGLAALTVQHEKTISNATANGSPGHVRLLSQIEASKAFAGAAAEVIGLDTHSLGQRNKQIRQRGVVRFVMT